jgi:hypothetical protein
MSTNRDVNDRARRPFRSWCPLPLARVAHPDARCETGPLDVEQGCLPDNAACEGFFGRLKTELFYSRDWQTTTIEQLIQVVDNEFIG